jgi:3-mercaptopyruvate sulfurtransferase SseA
MNSWKIAPLLLAMALAPPAVAFAAPLAVRFITVADLHALVVRGTAPVLVDVRSREEYEARHIPGAASIPLTEITQRAPEIPRGPLVVLY